VAKLLDHHRQGSGKVAKHRAEAIWVDAPAPASPLILSMAAAAAVTASSGL
jgi:hypothetical protein